jgi:hypothetical protein
MSEKKHNIYAIRSLRGFMTCSNKKISTLIFNVFSPEDEKPDTGMKITGDEIERLLNSYGLTTISVNELEMIRKTAKSAENQLRKRSELIEFLLKKYLQDINLNNE